MVIEFPKKYSVKKWHDRYFTISVPVEKVRPLLDLLNQQPWLANVFGPDLANKDIKCTTSAAYDVTDEQAHDALCRLCEHVMSPPADVDMTVWGDALESEE